MSGKDRFQLSTRQLKALNCLVTGETVSSSAEGAGVSERQVYRWLQPGTIFSAELNRLKADMMRLSGVRLVALSERAIQALEDTLEEPGAPGAGVRFRCAVSVLELVDKFRQTEDLEERVLNLERLYDAH